MAAAASNFGSIFDSTVHHYRNHVTLAITNVVDSFNVSSVTFYTINVVSMATCWIHSKFNHYRFPMFSMWCNDLSVEFEGDYMGNFVSDCSINEF